MKTNAVRFAAGLVFFIVGAPFPACGQFIYPPVFVVPPPAQDYGSPRPASRRTCRIRQALIVFYLDYLACPNRPQI
jgi:hypothetical protein